MSRTRATALALVNWKGVFYERYQLDKRVTALEGANGAGKTTVMIAAYIVLPVFSVMTEVIYVATVVGDDGISTSRIWPAVVAAAVMIGVAVWAIRHRKEPASNLAS